MLVAELIQKLMDLPISAEVELVYDGAARLRVDCVWSSRDGRVLLTEAGELVYSTVDRPKDAPDDISKPYWTIEEQSCV